MLRPIFITLFNFHLRESFFPPVYTFPSIFSTLCFNFSVILPSFNHLSQLLQSGDLTAIRDAGPALEILDIDGDGVIGLLDFIHFAARLKAIHQVQSTQSKWHCNTAAHINNNKLTDNLICAASFTSNLSTPVSWLDINHANS